MYDRIVSAMIETDRATFSAFLTSFLLSRTGPDYIRWTRAGNLVVKMVRGGEFFIGLLNIVEKKNPQRYFFPQVRVNLFIGILLAFI